MVVKPKWVLNLTVPWIIDGMACNWKSVGVQAICLAPLGSVLLRASLSCDVIPPVVANQHEREVYGA